MGTFYNLILFLTLAKDILIYFIFNQHWMEPRARKNRVRLFDLSHGEVLEIGSRKESERILEETLKELKRSLNRS